jgi:uncharacterized protein (TIRG00374 family)
LDKIWAWLRRHRAWQKVATLLILGAAVYVFLPRVTELEGSWRVLTAMDPWAVGLAFLAQGASYVGSGFLLQGILEVARQETPLRRSTLMVLGAASLGLVGGTVGVSTAIYRWTREGKGSLRGATLAALFVPQFNSIMLALVSVFGLIYLTLAHRLTSAQLIGFVATLLILALILGAVALLARLPNQATRVVLWLAGRLARLRGKPFDPDHVRHEVRALVGAWYALRHGAWRRPAAGACLNIAFDILTLYLIFVAAQGSVSPGLLLAGYGLPLLLGKVAFVIPAGLGVVEASMVALYSGLGVPQATATAVVLSYRLISFWIPSLVGYPVAVYLTNRVGRGS